MKYGITNAGIVFRYSSTDDDNVTCPYGERSWPRSSAWRSLGGSDNDNDNTIARALFNVQRQRVWDGIVDLMPLLDATFCDSPERASDIGMSILGYAILTYDETRGVSLRSYARSLLRRMSNARSDNNVTGDTAQINIDDCNIGHESNIDDTNIQQCAQYLSVLTAEQRKLLLLRYVDELSYAQIADEFGYKSRQTAANKIHEALQICQNASWKQIHNKMK